MIICATILNKNFTKKLVAKQNLSDIQCYTTADRDAGLNSQTKKQPNPIKNPAAQKDLDILNIFSSNLTDQLWSNPTLLSALLSPCIINTYCIGSVPNRYNVNNQGIF